MVSNVVAVPLASLVLLPALLGGLLVHGIAPPLSAWSLDLGIALADLLAGGCRWIASVLPMPVLAPPSPVEWLLWAVAVMSLLPWARRWRWRWLAALAAACALVVGRLVAGPAGANDEGTTRITFVDVGQGDAAVIELADGGVWLVDGGGLPFVTARSGADARAMAESPARRVLLPYLRLRRIRHIDLAILSHPHPDHILGLRAVSRRMPIAELWTPEGSIRESGAYGRWLRSIERRGTVVRAPELGRVRSRAGATLDVLWPRYREERGGSPWSSRVDPILSVNDNSLVVRLEAGGRRVLFAGDIEAEAEELMLADPDLGPTALRADVVKVPHHGSRTSSSAAFVDAVRPLVAVISCGVANRFDFPAPAVQSRWQSVAPELLRTDQLGSISIDISRSGAMWLHWNDGLDPAKEPGKIEMR
jgi:competence protein ComEC